MRKNQQTKGPDKEAPVKKQQNDIFDFLKGKVVITGDIIAPALTKEEWGRLWPDEDD